jgi:glycosyltransferase involved in cell wall biosynthesis
MNVNGTARILYVAYPLLTVSQESAGGAEQLLWTLEREMTGRGVETVVAASAGSQVSGELFPTGEPSCQTDDLERRNREHQDRIVEFIHERAHAGRPFSLIHDHSGSFWSRAPEAALPLLATLHLPRSLYPPQFFESVPANVSFNCVSNSQGSKFTGLGGFAGVIANGIPLNLFDDPVKGPARTGLLWLGRICEEKAPHLALEIARSARLPIILAGQVYPFSYHQQYFDSEVAPHLRQAPEAALISLPSFHRKRQLLREARAVLITSQVDETSSLVAMEAAASGTPVIAFARGALPEIIRHGHTGFLVDGVEAAVAALAGIAEIDSARCRHYAREHFSSTVMAEGYARLYAQFLNGALPALDSPAAR